MQSITDSNSWADFVAFQVASTSNEKGCAFEELPRLYLLADSLFRTKLEEIWHHSSVPQDVVDELDLQQPEIWVYLVAKAFDRTYWAIQCKYH